MRLLTDTIGLVTLILVSLGWQMLGAIFLFRSRPALAEQANRARGASWGIALQSLSFASVWSLPRPRFWPATPSPGGEIALATGRSHPGLGELLALFSIGPGTGQTMDLRGPGD
jgi:hypothetical protein